MQNAFICIVVIGFLGFLLVGIALLKFNKMGKEHKKVSNDDFLLESEKIIQNRNIKIFITGLSIISISLIAEVSLSCIL